MTWNLTDADMRATITEGLAPPGDVNSLLGDDQWAGIFSMWCTDYGYGSGDYQPSYLYALWRDFTYATPWEQMRATYVDEGGPAAMTWPASVVDRFERLAAGMEDDSSGALGELWNSAVEKFDQYLPVFFADVREMQAQTPSQPTAVALTRAMIDQAVVDSINQAVLKNLDGGGGGDSFISYVQAGDLVLIGDDHPPQYVEWVMSNRGGAGQIYMNSKGGFASRGELLVQGHGSYHANQDDFKAAIRRFSQKKLSFR